MLANLTHYLVRFKMIFIIPLLSFSVMGQAQIIVSGKISSSTGQPVESASVLEKGTTNGTTTKADGTFTLSVKNTSSVLVISHIGFENQELTVGNRTEFNLSLKQGGSNNLTDVVVIGYGERRRKDVTGAVSSISSKDIEKSTSMSPELALQGTAAGVAVTSGGGDPNARPIIRIRGTNTFGYADPLYVIDGVPVYEGGAGVISGGIGDIRGQVNIYTLINPEDIESISVLKDASAAAIYGVRASNGVILITTKKGKIGKPRVEVSTYFGIQNIPKKIQTLSTQQFVSKVTEAYNNNPDKDATSGDVLPIGQSPTFGPLYDPASPSYAGNGTTTDWVGAILNKNAPLQSHNVRVSGGNESTSYYFSAGYSKTESPLKANNLERYSIASNVESKISKYISAGLTIRLSQENALVNTQADIPTMLNSIPFQPLYDRNDPTGFAPVAAGTFVANPDFDPTLLSAGPDSIFADGSPALLYGKNTRFNVLAFEALNNTDYELFSGLGNAFVQIEPIPGLRLKATLGGQYNFNLRKTWSPIDTWRFSQTPGNPYSGQDGNSKGGYGERQSRTTNLNKEVTLNYNHTFAADHNIDILLSASNQFSRWQWTDVSGQVNYTDPQYRSVNNQPPYNGAAAGILQEDALLGYLARASYKYKDKYYLDGTIRYDGSSRLAPGHKFESFPSFAAAWRISSENFFPKTTFINDLKIRGGWGKLGNYQSAAYYAFLSNVSLTPDYSIGSGNGDALGRQVQGAALPNFANTTLTWEKVKTTSIGFDAVLFSNHVNFTAEYYNKTTYGIIQAVSLPPNTGIEAPADLNVATVRNTGIELQAGYATKFGDIDFNVAGNISTVNNKVIALNEGNAFGSPGNGNEKIEQGYSLNYLYGYKVGGIFQSQAQIDSWRQSHADLTIGQSITDPTVGYKYQPGDMYFQDVYGNPRPGSKEQHSPSPDSLVNSNDRTYLGKTIPGYTYGFSVGAAYKGFDISVLFQGVGDVQGYNSLRAGLDNPGSIGNMSTKVLDSWTASNHSTIIPRAVYNDPSNPNRFSDRFVEQGGYLRLKNLTIGYSLPKSLLTKMGFVQNFRIYVSSINLLTITKWTGLDPETDLINYSDGTSLQGTPSTRQFLVGLRVSFN